MSWQDVGVIVSIFLSISGGIYLWWKGAQEVKTTSIEKTAEAVKDMSENIHNLLSASNERIEVLESMLDRCEVVKDKIQEVLSEAITMLQEQERRLNKEHEKFKNGMNDINKKPLK